MTFFLGSLLLLFPRFFEFRHNVFLIWCINIFVWNDGHAKICLTLLIVIEVIFELIIKLRIWRRAALMGCVICGALALLWERLCSFLVIITMRRLEWINFFIRFMQLMMVIERRLRWYMCGLKKFVHLFLLLFLFLLFL